MRCGFLLPAGRTALHLDPVEPVLTAQLRIEWVGRKVPATVSAVVDTGSPVDLVASSDLAKELRRDMKPVRQETLDWGGRWETQVYVANVKFAVWQPVEIHAPLEGIEENLLGLRALLKANLCIRGEDGSAHWADLPPAGDHFEFVTRDTKEGGYQPHPAGSKRKSVRKRTQ